MGTLTDATEVVIPYKPRPQQDTLHDLLDANRFVVAVAHRRLGKSVMAINHLIRAAATCAKERPRFAYIAPTFRMAKQAAWDYLLHFSNPIPGVDRNVAELRIDLPNKGQVKLYGADNPDSLRGIYLDGVVLDEFGLMASNVFSEVIRPALADREGWALFIGTPNGKNQFWDMAQFAQTGQPGWAFISLPVSQTHILPEVELQAARAVMTDDEYRQEFEASFEASVRGAIYARELEHVRAQGRITRVPVDPLLPVETTWDLGVGDATAIWFSQSLPSGELRLVDYYEQSGEGLPHYAQVLKEKGYVYGAHWAPHDIQVRELGSGRSRLETAATLGIRFKVCPNIPLEDGIHAVRMLLPLCWFDDAKTQVGREALQHYRRDYNTRVQEYKATPVHDFAEHGASAFRYLAVRHKTPTVERPLNATPYRPVGPWT